MHRALDMDRIYVIYYGVSVLVVHITTKETFIPDMFIIHFLHLAMLKPICLLLYLPNAIF